ncbi:MAG: LptF/LptG family permease, partial [Wenzhouxiangellaceae bacterium]|nr:LptF/LptG family permease [Wenzhouxiangellaceae bacterium]
EIVAMRAAGFDRGRIAARVLAAVLLATLAIVVFGETVVPAAETRARVERERARDGQVGIGDGQALWVRDGDRVFRADVLAWDERGELRFGNLRIYALDASFRPVALTTARSARHEPGRWLLERVHELDLETGRASRRIDERAVPSGLDPGVFRALVTRPRLLPIRDIQRIRRYLEATGLDAGAYREAFWRRVVYPLNVVAMVLVGLPLVFRGGRTASALVGVFAGIAVGVAFIVVQRIGIGLAPVVPLPAGIVHALPALVFGAVGFRLISRA